MGAERSEPGNVIERACDAGMRMIEQELELAGAEAVQVVVLLEATGVPAGEKSSCSVSRGDAIEGGIGLLAWTLVHAQGLAKEIGIPLELGVPVGTFGQREGG